MNRPQTRTSSASRTNSESDENENETSNFTFVKKFKKEGKQGLAGICKLESSSGTKKVVYKLSRYLNYTAKHEHKVMTSLNKIIPFCPYFCESVALLNVPLSSKFREQSNPFAISSSKYQIQGDVLLMEYIRGKNLYSLIKRNDIDDRVIFAAMRQTLYAIMIAQQEEKFTHYDLHSSNIIMTPCQQDSVALFITGDKTYTTPTYGAKPVIIDFGFSYAGEIANKPITSSLAHTDIGFTSHMYDKYADAKLFLVSLAHETTILRNNSKHFRLFRKAVRKIFKPLKLDLGSGWDKGYTTISAIDRVSDFISHVEPATELFSRYNHFALDVVQNMIKLPLNPKPIGEIALAFKAVDNEMKKFEDELGSSFFILYIFKFICKLASKLRKSYMDKYKRKRTIRCFKRQIYEALDKVSKYCLPDINCERLLCGLLVYSESVEGVLYQCCKQLNKDKGEDYKNMDYKNLGEICNYIDYMLPEKYHFTTKTVIRISNVNDRKYEEMNLTQNQCKILNQTSSELIGEVLREFYEKKNSRITISGVNVPSLSDSENGELSSDEEFSQEDDEEDVSDEDAEEDVSDEDAEEDGEEEDVSGKEEEEKSGEDEEEDNDEESDTRKSSSE
ncbi:MAG: hypothetical protein KAJ19_11005, partial [Gammaproteobacteria bacterium]|nr:hypothetical protein [Gammaproteobacteria bacterium]